MADKISTIILNVDLKGCNCDKRIKKTLCKLQERENIHTIAFDEKKNTVTISGPFDPDKICKKLCCKAGKVIIGIEIKKKDAEPKKDESKDTEQKKDKDKDEPKDPEPEKPKPNTKPSEPVKVEQSVVVQVTQLGYQPPVWQPGTSCGCGCRCGGCRRCPSWAPAYKTCTFFYPQSSCSVMCNCRFH